MCLLLVDKNIWSSTILSSEKLRKMEKIIHLRYIPEKEKFQLTIPLKIVFQHIEVDGEIETECSKSDTIGILLEQTKVKIKNVICDKLARTVKIESNDIEIYLRRKRQQGYKIIPEDLTVSVIMSQDHKKTRMRIFDREYGISVNSPKVKHFSLPPVLYASYSVYPIRFDGLYIQYSLCKFNWYRSKDKIVWEKVIDGVCYPIKFEDIGYFLKVTCRPFSSQEIEGPSTEVISDGVVLEFPEIPQCPFDLRHSYTRNILPDRSFRIVSYNTLSSRYTFTDDKYSYCPNEFLVMDYRKQLILKEILGYNADIVCLQEIDEIVYSRFFKSALEKEGYLSKFYRKGFYLTEGLMCAVRKSRFKLKSYEQIVFGHALKRKEIFSSFYNILQKDKPFLKKFGMQSSSMLIMTLKCKDENRIILVGNIHLSHDPTNNDIRLIHCYMAILYLNHMKKKLESIHSNFTVNIILCGDFNSAPDSAVYDFVRNGSVQSQDYVVAAGCCLRLAHSLSFKSVCGSPKYTCFTPTFKNCIDYIFVGNEVNEYDTKVEADVKQVVPFLIELEVEKYMGLPNRVFPSDHLALVADIEFSFII